MPNLFLGFPVPRAKIAEMIEGYAPPLAHVARHRPPGDDPLALPADIAAGQLLGWDGSKFVGQAGGGGGIASVYDDPGYPFLTFFESLAGYYYASSPTGGVTLSNTQLSLMTQGGANDWASLYKEPSEFVALWSWSKLAKFKTEVTLAATGSSLPKIDVMFGDTDTGRHFGFIVRDGKLYGSVGNNSVETLTAALEDWGAVGYYKTKRLEAVYNVTSVDFWVGGVKVATLSDNLPAGTTSARKMIRLYVRGNGSASYHGIVLSHWIAWKEI